MEYSKFSKGTAQEFVEKAVQAYKHSRQGLNDAAKLAAYRALQHGDVTLLSRMMEDMGTRSQTRKNVAAYIREHCFFMGDDGKRKQVLHVGFDKDGKTIVRVAAKNIRDEHKDEIMQRLDSQTYWETIEPVHVKAPFELDKSLLAIIKKAKKQHAVADLDDMLNHVRKVWEGATAN